MNRHPTLQGRHVLHVRQLLLWGPFCFLILILSVFNVGEEVTLVMNLICHIVYQTWTDVLSYEYGFSNMCNLSLSILCHLESDHLINLFTKFLLCRTHGIFRLSDPGGVSVIQQCQKRGFHPHEEPPEGGPIYEHCSHVFMNPKLQFDVIDLRQS